MKPAHRPAAALARFVRLLALTATLVAAAPAQAQAATPALPVQFLAGDRVILVGDPAEALAADGTFEALLQSRLPDLKLTLRTPDVPSDEITGLPAAKALREALRREQAEVVILFVGEGKAAEAGAALDGLCGEILEEPFSRRGTARLALVTAPAADGKAAEAVRKIARKRGVPHLDLRPAAAAAPVAPSGSPSPKLSAWALAHVLMRELGLALPEAALILDAEDLRFAARVGTVDRTLRDGRIRRLELINVPQSSPPPPDGEAWPALVPDPRRNVRVMKLEPGDWTLGLDGETLATAGANEWAAGLHVTSRVREAQAARLREAAAKRHALHRTGSPELGEADVQVWELSAASPKIIFSIGPAAAPAAPGKS
ncbi:MAG: hypothetical protein ACKVYV_16930 [Limisphaerales bacterium]